MYTTGKHNSFWREIGIIIIGTTISILLTIGSSQLLEKRQRAKDRELTAMMVLSNIESSARQMEDMSVILAQIDTIGAWLLAQPVEKLELIPDDDFKMMMNTVTTLTVFHHDETAEKIFSDNIDTWKNMESFQFIDNVGKTFAVINTIENYWADWVKEMENSKREIIDHPNDYEGKNIMIKCLLNDKVRSKIERIHSFRGWMEYSANLIRYNNQFNMVAIGISEEDIIAFTNERQKVIEFNERRPEPYDYYTPELNPDSLLTFKSLDEYLDSIAGK